HPIAEETEEPLILVVDDDATVRELVVRHLERAGFAAVAARGGQEGLRLARELRPAAVGLDHMIPDLHGWTGVSAVQGGPEPGGHSGGDDVDRRPEEPRLRAWRGGLPGQAGRSRQAGGDAEEYLRRDRGTRSSGRRRRGGPPQRTPSARAAGVEGDRGGERPGSRRLPHRRTARRDHPRPDDADDGRVRVHGPTARTARLAGHPGRGHHRKRPDGGGSRAPQWRRRAHYSKKRSRPNAASTESR